MLSPNPSTPNPLPEDVRFGNFTVRLGATLIDLIVMAPLVYLNYYFMVNAPNLAVAIAVAGLEALYKPVTEKVYGKTLGKHVMKLRVVNQHDLGPISWNQTATRYLPWAVVFFASVFTMIRFAEDPNFIEVQTQQEYFDYVRNSKLGQSTLLSILNNLPIFSALFIITDPLARALHDRWAQTYVISTPRREVSGPQMSA